MRGFSVAMSHIIFFIATIVALSIAVSAISMALKGLSYAMQKKAEVSAAQVSTFIKVVDGGYDDANGLLWVYVQNLGTTDLEVNGFNVFVDGRYAGSCNDGTVVCRDETSDYLLSKEEILEVNLPYSLSSGSHRVRIVSEYGVYADYAVVVG